MRLEALKNLALTGTQVVKAYTADWTRTAGQRLIRIGFDVWKVGIDAEKKGIAHATSKFYQARQSAVQIIKLETSYFGNKTLQAMPSLKQFNAFYDAAAQMPHAKISGAIFSFSTIALFAIASAKKEKTTIAIKEAAIVEETSQEPSQIIEKSEEITPPIVKETLQEPSTPKDSASMLEQMVACVKENAPSLSAKNAMICVSIAGAVGLLAQAVFSNK